MSRWDNVSQGLIPGVKYIAHLEQLATGNAAADVIKHAFRAVLASSFARQYWL